jgi:hypothetical protein
MAKKALALTLLILPFISCIDPNEAAMLPPDEYRFYTDLQSYAVGDTVILKCGYYLLSYGEEVSRELEEDSVEFLNTDDVSPADVRVVFEYVDA